MGAVAEVFGGPGDPEAVANVVSQWSAEELEAAVVGAGGCAGDAAGRRVGPPSGRCGRGGRSLGGVQSRRSGSAHGSFSWSGGDPAARRRAGARPHPGDRRARVHAVPGRATVPTCCASTRPASPRCPPSCRRPPWASAAPPSTCAPAGRARFEDLVAPGPRARGGLPPRRARRAGLRHSPDLRALQPGAGGTLAGRLRLGGPWRARRGFDSLVQMSTGITATGAAATGRRPARSRSRCRRSTTAAGYLLAAVVAGPSPAPAHHGSDHRGADVAGGRGRAAVRPPRPRRPGAPPTAVG